LRASRRRRSCLWHGCCRARQYIFYLLPVHVGAVGLHTFKGQPILSRINPFASPK